MATARTRILTSGDLTADRRADYAAQFSDAGDHAAAAELIEQALELVPDWAAGWFRLGEYREKAGNADAVIAYRRTLELAPDDIFGAGLKLALLGGSEKPLLPPSSYVEGLFDDYADRFDVALVERLAYTVPAKLLDLVGRYEPGPYGLVIDLGCGTGLVGAELEGQCQRLEGFDLSENMLAKAEAKGFYDILARADLSLEPAESGLFNDRPANHADLVIAADVMMYLGDLNAAFANVAGLVRPSGLFAFSVEKADAGTGYELRPSLRFAHSADHVEAQLAAHHMRAIAQEETTIRMDAGQPITGLLFLARPV